MEVHYMARTPERIVRRQKRQCPSSKKESFHGRKQALTFAAWSKKTFGKEFDAYKCPGCNQWHITTRNECIVV